MYDNNLNREDIDLIKEMINYCSSTLVSKDNNVSDIACSFNDYLSKVGKKPTDSYNLGVLYTKLVKTLRENNV